MPRLDARLASLLVLVVGAGACGEGDEHVPLDGPAAIDARATLDAASDAALDAPSTRLCGGFAGAVCDPTEYCDFPRNNCGATDKQGVCRPRPTGCPDLVFMPTCACDGMVYGNACDVYAAGSDLNAFGSCPVPAGSFACGYTQCSVFNQYCLREVSDVADEPDGYGCRALPGCPSQFPTCACLANEPCGSMCSGAGVTGLTLTCPGG